MCCRIHLRSAVLRSRGLTQVCGCRLTRQERVARAGGFTRMYGSIANMIVTSGGTSGCVWAKLVYVRVSDTDARVLLGGLRDALGRDGLGSGGRYQRANTEPECVESVNQMQTISGRSATGPIRCGLRRVGGWSKRYSRPRARGEERRERAEENYALSLHSAADRGQRHAPASLGACRPNLALAHALKSACGKSSTEAKDM
jgi:hypothetical protein